jgi:hypothetical protein
MKMIRRLLGNTVFTSGVFAGVFIGIGITHWFDGGNIVLSIAVLAWSSIGVLVADWALLGGDLGQKQMDER